MNAKEYLQKIKALDIKVRKIEEEIEDIKLKMTGTNSKVRGEGSSGCNTKSPQEKYIHKCLEIEDELEKAKIKALNYRYEAFKAINNLNNADFTDVLYKRYFENKRWETIAKEKYYSYQGVLKIHGKALLSLNELLGSIQK